LAKSRAQKEEQVGHYKAQIEQASAMVFTDFRGMTVPEFQSLRAKLDDTDTTYMVVKNSLFAIALDQSGLPQPEDFLEGLNGVVFLGEDIGKGMKALKNWISDEKICEIKGSLLESRVLDATQTEALSDLPTADQVKAQLLGMLSAPASALGRIINAPGSGLVRVIDAHTEQERVEAA
jgi:large subunit ribosomal protein L10